MKDKPGKREPAGSMVIIGAGNIGRGFIGQLFSQAGYEVVFVDVDIGLVEAMNRERQYPVRLVSRDGATDHWIGPVRAVNGRDMETVEATIAGADLLATSVGAGILPRIAPVIAAGLVRRWKVSPPAPLDILLCENLMDADRLMHALLETALPEALCPLLDTHAGLVETSIGRMVPVMTEEMKAEHPLLVCAEPYDRLPVDAAAFKGPIPSVPTLEPVSPFRFYLERKLYLHNMGHCLTAYLGFLQGCRYIHEAIGLPDIYGQVGAAMREAATALAKRHQQPLAPLLEHVADLLYRFGNPALGDTVLRVGRDPIRKLAPEDRLTGCARMCISEGVFPAGLVTGMAAAFRFNPEEDDKAQELQAECRQEGVPACLERYAGLKTGEPLAVAVVEAYEGLSSHP